MSAAHLPRRQFFTPAPGSPTACYLREDVTLEAARRDVDAEVAVVKRERDGTREELRLAHDAVARLCRERDEQRDRANMAEENLRSATRQLRVVNAELLNHRCCPRSLELGEDVVDLVHELVAKNKVLADDVTDLAKTKDACSDRVSRWQGFVEKILTSRGLKREGVGTWSDEEVRLVLEEELIRLDRALRAK